jgi:hypothetical protein
MSNSIVDDSGSRKVPISRRSALRAGTLATLAAGLLGAAGTTPTSAAPAPGAITLEQILAASSAATRERLAAASLAVLDRYDEIPWRSPDFYSEDDERLKAGISGEMYELHAAMMRDIERKTEMFSEWQVAELVRHLPMLSPILTAGWEHIGNMQFTDAGVCCLGGAS